MTVKQILRIAVDCAMTILLICAYAYRITGDTFHEWLGISVFVFFTAHNVINRRWWTRIKAHRAEYSPLHKNIFKEKFTLHRVIMTAVNILLAFITATLIITGLLQSRAVLVFLHLPGGMALRLIHTTAAYWLIPLIGFHVGLHWGLVARRIGKNRLTVCVARITMLVVVVFGVWSSFDRDMFPKLFLGFSFDYWPSERPVALFFAETLSIMGIFIFLIYYAPKVIIYFRNRYLQHKSLT